MTVRIYQADSYIREFDGTVISATGKTVVLDRTSFFPAGGGQPSDIGRLISEKGTFNVVETRSEEDTVVHLLGSETSFVPGDKVHGLIDWEKRYRHMRLHTAFHIIDGVVEREYLGSVIGGQIFDNRATMDLDIQGLDRNIAAEIISKAQEIVDSSIKVYPKILLRDEALRIPNLSRTAPGRELLHHLNEIRVIVIEGFDMQMDGGTHVSNTKEVGGIELLKYRSKGSHNKRVEIKLEQVVAVP